MISSKKYVDETLKKYNLVANKSLGQNFLVESDIAEYIVNSANITKDSCVIEIGPGLGALTEFIVKQAGLVMAFEIDLNMVNILNNTFTNHENLTINNVDFLKVDIEKLIQEINQKGYTDIIILSNLPYYITSKLLNKILINNYNIHTIVTMMQKEVGQKIMRPEKKEYNSLSVILDYQYNVSIVKHVGKNSYLPRPEIDSIVLKFEKVEPKKEANFANLLNVANCLFAARRKTVYNNLKTLINDNQQILEILNKCNIGIDTHIEQLSFEDIVNISNYI